MTTKASVSVVTRTSLAVAIAAATAWAQQKPEPVAFGDYWYQGKAELSRYALTQSRYGEPREGHAVLVFVTEDFNTGLQVKDEGGAAPADTTTVLKLNRIQRFATGVYDYSLMQSVFTPIDRAAEPHTLKATASIQDWCGHTWTQLNLVGDSFRVTGHSYFEREADQQFEVPAALLEDEVWTLIRIDPDALPVGELQAVPGSFDSRLRHRELRAERADASLRDGSEGTMVYELRYPDAGRTLSITFEKELPHGILAFREEVGSAVIEGERTHVIMRDYWNHNGRRHAPERGDLGLEAGDVGRK